MPPSKLDGILRKLPRIKDDNLLVDIDTMDDAGVYLVAPDLALVQTLDFFFPAVNDPFDFGRIVAANSLSDVYAMGVVPRTAMNILAYPPAQIPAEMIEELLKGGCDKLNEAEVTLLGGHTQEQETFLYGMSITGTARPQEVLTNAAARPGDSLILTKPIGTGVLCDAHNHDGLSEEDYKELVDSMTRLNRYATETLRNFDVSALTDVTGFGLLGHLLPEVKNGSLSCTIMAEQVPFFTHVFDLMETYSPKGVGKSVGYVEPYLEVGDLVDPKKSKLLYEAQTSGGLLAAVKPEQAEEAVAALREAGDKVAALIGSFEQRCSSPWIRVV